MAGRTRLPSRGLALAGLLGTLVLGAAGCGADSEQPSDEQQVRTVVERFARASAGHDYGTICDELFAPALVEGVEKVGLPCESALQRGLGEVRDPRLAIRQISVGGDKALVSIHTTAVGQPASDDALGLVRTDGRWRISTLTESGSTATPSTTATTTTATTPTTTTATTPTR